MPEDPFKPIVDFPEPTEEAGGVHNPGDTPLVDVSEIIGLLRVRSTVPTGVPRKFSEQIVIVVAGGVSSLYVYDPSNTVWKSAALI